MRRTDWEPKTDRPLSVENPTSQKKSIKLLNRKKWESSPLPDHIALSKRPVLFQRAKESVRENLLTRKKDEKNHPMTSWYPPLLKCEVKQSHKEIPTLHDRDNTHTSCWEKKIPCWSRQFEKNRIEKEVPFLLHQREKKGHCDEKISLFQEHPLPVKRKNLKNLHSLLLQKKWLLFFLVSACFAPVRWLARKRHYSLSLQKKFQEEKVENILMNNMNPVEFIALIKNRNP